MSKEQTKARALAALMECNTLTAAAEKAGITRKTLYTYMTHDAEFAAAYREAMEQAALIRAESIEADRQRAREVIFSIMEDKEQSGGVRLKAALSVLDAIAEQEERAEKIACKNVAAASNPFGLPG